MSDNPERSPLENPYEAPRSSLAPPVPTLGTSFLSGEEKPETVRVRYLEREATVRTIGLIYAAMGLMVLLNFGYTLIVMELWRALEDQAVFYGFSPWVGRLLPMILVLAISAGLIALGLELRRLRNWARWVVMILLGLLLLFWVRIFLTSSVVDRALSGDLGSVSAMAAFGLRVFLLCSLMKSESQLVCTAYFRSIIAETPQLRPRRGTRDWVLLVIYASEIVIPVARHFLR